VTFETTNSKFNEYKKSTKSQEKRIIFLAALSKWIS
jgi:hypothetical protein